MNSVPCTCNVRTWLLHRTSSKYCDYYQNALQVQAPDRRARQQGKGGSRRCQLSRCRVVRRSGPGMQWSPVWTRRAPHPRRPATPTPRGTLQPDRSPRPATHPVPASCALHRRCRVIPRIRITHPPPPPPRPLLDRWNLNVESEFETTSGFPSLSFPSLLPPHPNAPPPRRVVPPPRPGAPRDIRADASPARPLRPAGRRGRGRRRCRLLEEPCASRARSAPTAPALASSALHAYQYLPPRAVHSMPSL